MHKSDSQFNYRRDIDGLRAIAVLLVLIFHFKLTPLGKGGFLGVDVFFVISGFLITSIICRGLDSGIFSLVDFYIKRVKRLAPALFVTLFVTLLLGYFLLLPNELTELARQLIASQFYFSNIYYWQNVNYFGLQVDTIPLLHTWSLAVEEQFYLLFPLVLLIVYRINKKLLWPCILAGFSVSFLLNITFAVSKPEFTFYLVPTRGWELLIGSILALAVTKIQIKTALVSNLLSVTGIGLIATAVFGYSEAVTFPGYYAILPTAGAALIILSGTYHKTILATVLSSQLMVYIGRLSYSLYLLHWPIHVFASQTISEGYNYGWRVAMLGLTFVLAVVTLHAVEDPIRRGVFINTNKPLLITYLAGLGATVLITVALLQTNGLPNRFSEHQQQIASYSEDRPPPMLECQAKESPYYTDADFCRLGATNIAPTWLVVGDSHAWAASEAFSMWLTKKGESALFMFRHSCPPTLGVYLQKGQSKCKNHNDKLFSYLKTSSTIKDVLLSSTWIQAKHRITDDTQGVLSEADRIRYFEDQFTHTVNELTQSGKRISVWGPLPGAKAHVPRSLALSNDVTKTAERISVSTQEHNEQFNFFYKILEKHEKDIHYVFKPSKSVCSPGGLCSTTIDDLPLYYDASHIAYSHSGFWADELFSREPKSKKSSGLQQ